MDPMDPELSVNAHGLTVIFCCLFWSEIVRRHQDVGSYFSRPRKTIGATVNQDEEGLYSPGGYPLISPSPAVDEHVIFDDFHALLSICRIGICLIFTLNCHRSTTTL